MLPGEAPGAEAATDIPTDNEYERIGHLLEPSEFSPSPAEAHGILCGLICGGAEDPKRAWLGEIFPRDARAPALDDGSGGGSATDILGAEAARSLGRLADRTLEAVRGPDLALRVLLPDDSRPLAERAIGLYDWVRGFLFAFGVLGLSGRELSEQGREVLRDFSSLTQLDLDDLEEGESNEAALTELTEHVRIAAMLLYQERPGAREEPP